MKYLLRPKIVCLAVIAAVIVAVAFELGFGTLCAAGIETLSTLCPLGTLEVGLASGSVTLRSVLILIVIVASILLFGRYFCGWFCPNLLFRQNGSTKKKCIPIKPEKPAQKSGQVSSALPLGVLGGTLLSSAVFGIPVFCLICPIGLFFAFVLGVWHLLTGTDTAWLTLAAPVVILVEWVFFKRWCSSFCPVGALISLISRFNKTFRPTVNPSRCLSHQGKDCRVCQTVCPEGINLLDPKADLSRCTKCRRCAEHCPNDAISFPFLAKPAAAAATPTAVPAEAPRMSPTAEAQRCLLCGRCEAACPQHKPLTEVLRLLKDGQTRAAADLLAQPGELSDMCGAVCPSRRLCEGACPLSENGAPIAIRAMEAELVRDRLPRGTLPRLTNRVTGRVAVVGSGPAGLACADVLAEAGTDVTVYESGEEIGGLLTYGIPSEKLNKRAVLALRERLTDAGITFCTSTIVGHDVTYDALLQNFDALYLAPGLPVSVTSALQSTVHTVVTDVADFLKADAVCRLETGLPADAVRGKHVLCTGGASAMDAAAVALNEGAASVTVLMRRPEAAVRVPTEDIAELKKRGVTFLFESTVAGLSATEASAQILTKGVTTTVPADRVIRAFGFTGRPDAALQKLGVVYDEKGRIVVNDRHQTGNVKIFAGGDAVTGATLVTKAAQSGKDAAAAMLQTLRS